MGRKSFKCSICSILKSCCFPMGSRSEEANWDEGADIRRRMWPSDEDKGRWVAEPGIDRKASAFIAKFYESRVSDQQTFAV